MEHRSIPSLSASISSTDTAYTSTTATTSISPPLHSNDKTHNDVSTTVPLYYNSVPTESYQPIFMPVINITPLENKGSSTQEADDTMIKRHSDPLPRRKRWDDSQLEMELAEDDLFEHNHSKGNLKTIRRNLSASSRLPSSSSSNSSLLQSSPPLRFAACKLRFISEAFTMKQKFRHYGYQSGSSSHHSATIGNGSHHHYSTTPLQKIRKWFI